MITHSINTILTDNEIIDINEKAENILSSYDLDNFPINPEIIAVKEDIEVYKLPFKQSNVSGAIRKTKGKVQIYLNKDEISQRQRFTTAHELGHYYLHFKNRNEQFNLIDTDETFNRNSSELGLNKQELEANEFAASLLMPSSKVRDLQFQGYNEMQMANYFNVSAPAMRHRLRNLKRIGIL